MKLDVINFINSNRRKDSDYTVLDSVLLGVAGYKPGYFSFNGMLFNIKEVASEYMEHGEIPPIDIFIWTLYDGAELGIFLNRLVKEFYNELKTEFIICGCTEDEVKRIIARKIKIFPYKIIPDIPLIDNVFMRTIDSSNSEICSIEDIFSPLAIYDYLSICRDILDIDSNFVIKLNNSHFGIKPENKSRYIMSMNAMTMTYGTHTYFTVHFEKVDFFDDIISFLVNFGLKIEDYTLIEDYRLEERISNFLDYLDSKNYEDNPIALYVVIGIIHALMLKEINIIMNRNDIRDIFVCKYGYEFGDILYGIYTSNIRFKDLHEYAVPVCYTPEITSDLDNSCDLIDKILNKGLSFKRKFEKDPNVSLKDYQTMVTIEKDFRKCNITMLLNLGLVDEYISVKKSRDKKHLLFFEDDETSLSPLYMNLKSNINTNNIYNHVFHVFKVDINKPEDGQNTIEYIESILKHNNNEPLRRYLEVIKNILKT